MSRALNSNGSGSIIKIVGSVVALFAVLVGVTQINYRINKQEEHDHKATELRLDWAFNQRADLEARVRVLENKHRRLDP